MVFLCVQNTSFVGRWVTPASSSTGSKCAGLSAPFSRGHYFSVLPAQARCKAPTSSSHLAFVLGSLLATPTRSEGPKCAPLSAPFQGATVLVSCHHRLVVKPRPVALIWPLFFVHCLQHQRDRRPKVCSTIRPFSRGHCFSVLPPQARCKAATSSSHLAFVLGLLLATPTRSEGPKCARLSAPF